MFTRSNRFLLGIALALLLVCVLLAPKPSISQAAAPEIFISEYIEGTSFNKVLELYNGTGASIDLAAGGYALLVFFNGSPTAGLTINLTGSVAAGDVYVVAHASANASILAQADQISNASWYNGDDAVLLRKGGATIDVMGQVGLDPGIEWGSGLTSTADNTLQRKSVVCQGDANPADSFDPAAEWVGLATDTWSGLGSHSSACNPVFLINELDADQTGMDTAEFLELYDGGVGNAALDGLVVVLYNGMTDTSYQAFDLDGRQTNSEGYFVICGNASLVPNCDLDVSPDTDLIQNGADAAALYTGDATSFPVNTLVTLTNLLDALVYDTNDADDPGLMALLNPGQPQVNEDAKVTALTQSSQRCPNGSGGGRNTSTYSQFNPSPGAINTCPGVCGDPATPIHMVQGAGTASPLVGQVHALEGVVVGDFQETTSGLGGFFLQEEDAEIDSDPLTSEGIFVYDNGFGVAVATGDRVRVRGEVAEYYNLTELINLASLQVCSSVGPASAAAISLPVASLPSWEAYEGMLVSLSQPLYVTDTYNLGRYGEVDLSVNGRLFNPTQVAVPGAPALALQDLNDRSRIQLDDGSSTQNPLPLPPYLGVGNTLRIGDSTNGVNGVVSYSFGSYEIHPTQAVNFTRLNNRPVPPAVPQGTLKVASLNVLNYFTTLDTGAAICGPSGNLDCRGANTPQEFTRQRTKIISAILALDPDIAGLVEIENNASAAIQDLINGLNSSAGAGTYAFINTGTIGTDAIKVALIYKPAKVNPVAAYAILDSTVDPTFLDTKNRPTLAQTFETPGGLRFTVAVNHFKSKGSSCADVGDPDMNDGQGNCNQTRTNAAQALVNWLTNDPTSSHSTNFLILGDLNAYSLEDPVQAIKAGGYTSLTEMQVSPAERYSYTFEGQSGELDHMLVSSSLVGMIDLAYIFHINADEPRALDYNDYNQPLLYQPDAFRAADHDPLVVLITPQYRTHLPLIVNQY